MNNGAALAKLYDCAHLTTSCSLISAQKMTMQPQRSLLGFTRAYAVSEGFWLGHHATILTFKAYSSIF